MTHTDGKGPAETKLSGTEQTETYEIVTHVADAMAVLADAMAGNAGRLAGASIAKSVHGTLLLNGRAWELFGEILRRELPDVAVLQPARPSSEPLRFVLATGPLNPAKNT